MRINDPKLIATLVATKQGNTLLRDGSFIYVVFLEPVRMRPIVRRADELFTTTVARQASSFEVVVNGNFFGTTRSGKFHAFLGPTVSPSESSVQGQVVFNGQVIAGDSRPDRFYLAEVMNAAVKAKAKTPLRRWHYEIARGNPPTGKRVVTGIGNLGPLIADNLPYGVGNSYLPKHSGPPTGDPGPALSRYLIQRNDNLTRDVASRPPPLGKTIIAYHRHAGALLVGVQPDGTPPGQSSLHLRDALRRPVSPTPSSLTGATARCCGTRGGALFVPASGKTN